VDLRRSSLHGSQTESRSVADVLFADLGATFVVVKTGLDHSSPFVFLAVRFTIAAILMALFRPHVLGNIQRGEVFPGMRLAFFMFAGYCFQTAGLQYTTATNSGFVTGSSVVLVPLLLAIFWGRTLATWIYGGAFAALIGLYFLTVPAEGLRYLNRGDVLTFVAAGFYAVHVILVGEYSQEHSVSALSLIQVAGCALMAWPLTGVAGPFTGNQYASTGAGRCFLPSSSVRCSPPLSRSHSNCGRSNTRRLATPPSFSRWNLSLR
jgi:drug/metabolite transporter (DMT)-like permease